jgi:hypothetical protein
MPKPFDTWTVGPHGQIEKVCENIWRVSAPFPGAPFPRTMVLVRLADGRIIVHNGIALGEPEMKEIESWGRIAFLVVPSASHRMDAKIFKDRFPSLRVVAPPGAKQKVEEVVHVDDTEGRFGDEGVRYEILEGTKEREGVLSVKSEGGTTLVFNDAVMNMKSLAGFGGFLMSLFGFTGAAPKVSFPTRFVLVADRKAMRSHLERLAATDALIRLEVAHGAPVTERASDALRGAAAAL